MSRFSRQFKVYFFEEPVFGADEEHLQVTTPFENLDVVVPHLRTDISRDEIVLRQKELISKLFIEQNVVNFVAWYYTPMMLSVSDHLLPLLTVYDCIDELAAFKQAPRDLKEMEEMLFQRADVVFTAGYSLYETRKKKHRNIHPFPNSVDVEHFFRARGFDKDPADQSGIPNPRIGYFGVIDERFDVSLIDEVARRKFDWHFVVIGPVAKINASSLPKLPNIHYLGQKSYEELPAYIAGWDIAMMPFVHNRATRFISPGKIPEYLAAGKPVISTPVIDVIRQYGRDGLVNIAGTPDEFIRVAALELENTDRDEWFQRVNEFLSQNSWDKTWQRMTYLITKRLNDKQTAKAIKEQVVAC